jgi:hypothetical protein
MKVKLTTPSASASHATALSELHQLSTGSGERAAVHADDGLGAVDEEGGE